MGKLNYYFLISADKMIILFIFGHLKSTDPWFVKLSKSANLIKPLLAHSHMGDFSTRKQICYILF